MYYSQHEQTCCICIYKLDVKVDETQLFIGAQHGERTVGPLSSATRRSIIMQFTGFHQSVQRFYWPENAIDWLA